MVLIHHFATLLWDKKENKTVRELLLQGAERALEKKHSKAKLQKQQREMFPVSDDPVIEDLEEEEEIEPGYIEVEYNAAQMTYKMVRVRKALWLYGQYLKMYRALDEGNIFFQGDI